MNESTVGLQPIAQMENISIAMHRIEQSLTVIGAGAFAVAAAGIYGAVLADVPAPEEMPAMATAD